MRKLLKSVLFVLSLAPGLAAGGDWVSMFNGKDLAGWKSNAATEDPSGGLSGAFSVKNGELVVHGGRAHLFYVGSDGNAKFRNFEFRAMVKTTAGSNSGIYFHTVFEPKGWPSRGYECQVNATHTDEKKSGGLYAVADVLKIPPHKDDVWFEYSIKVEGRRIIISIDGKVTTDWTQPADWDPSKRLRNMPGRTLGEGTIAIQGHDPKSVVHYKDIRIRSLPDGK